MHEYTPSLARLAKLARTRKEFLASLLAVYQEQKKLDDQQLAEFLGCDVEALTHLALCRRPRLVPNFRPDIERIALHVQANPLRLMQLVRTAESLEDMRQEQNQAFLLAARDHDTTTGNDGSDEEETSSSNSSRGFRADQ